MAYKIKKGRPRQIFKIRSMEAITPSGFQVHQVKKDEIVFKRKG